MGRTSLLSPVHYQISVKIEVVPGSVRAGLIQLLIC